MIYKFIDDKGTFIVKNPLKYNLYFPLTDKNGNILSAIGPNLSGDIKKNNATFLTVPASSEDLRCSPLCRRDFFLKINNNEILRLSQAWDEDTLEAGFLYHKIIKKTKNIAAEITNFVPHDTSCEIMQIKIRNISKNTLKLLPTSFLPLFGRGEKNLRDHRHVSSLLNRVQLTKNGIVLTPTMVFDEKGHSKNRTSYFVFGYQDNAVAPQGQFPTLDIFLGESDIMTPDAVYKNIKPQKKDKAEFAGKEICAGLRFAEKTLKKGETTTYFLIMGIAQSHEEINRLTKRFFYPEKIAGSFEETKKYWLDYLAKISFDFSNRDFNGWLMWVKFQPTLRKLFGCSFLPHFDYGKGGRGWRDLWQDALTLLLTEPEKARALILNNFSGVRLDGSNATIISQEGNFIADRNKISRVWMDHGVWPYLTLKSYLNRTRDLNLLLEEIPYFRDHQLHRAKKIDASFIQKDFLQRDAGGNVLKSSVLEHVLLQQLVQFFNVGNHNVTRLENADWNDGLDMAPDLGESVTFSFMYSDNLKDICFFLKKLQEKTNIMKISKELIILLDTLNTPINYDCVQEKQNRLNDYFHASELPSGEKIDISVNTLIADLEKKGEHSSRWLKEHEWVEPGFFNGYYDNKGIRVEGQTGKRINMMLPPQVFAIMSGVAGPDQIPRMWQAAKKYLLDKKFGGFRLNTDFGDVYMDLGRAFGFSYGDKENGAVFSHMAVMFAHALYKQGYIKEGFEVINSIYKMSTTSGRIYPMIPEYFNRQGKGLYFFLTGSASWYVYTLIEEIIGIKFLMGDLAIEPKLTGKNFFKKNIGVSFECDGKKYNFRLTAENKKLGILRIKNISLEGKIIAGTGSQSVIKKEDIEKLNKKEIFIEITLTV